MKKYLIDTTIWIDFFRNVTGNIITSELVSASVVSYVAWGELIQGVKNKLEKKYINEIFKMTELDLGSPSISLLSIDILDKYALSHGIGVIDAIIAATALERKLTILTLNTKHFGCIKGLQVRTSL